MLWSMTLERRRGTGVCTASRALVLSDARAAVLLLTLPVLVLLAASNRYDRPAAGAVTPHGKHLLLECANPDHSWLQLTILAFL